MALRGRTVVDDARLAPGTPVVPAGTATTLSVRAVDKRFQGAGGAVSALEEIDLEVSKGEFVCLVGPSGCGKSTLLNLIAGLDQPSGGVLSLGGRPIVRPGADRVVMFQEAALFPWLNVRDNVAFGLSLAGVSRREGHARAAEYLDLVGLNGFDRAWIHELSGGMKQRVALARALVLEPEILLMDEPFAALDAQTRDRLLLEVQRIWLQTGKTIIFVTHSVREAAVLADRVLVFSARPGRITAEVAVSTPRPRPLDGPDVLAFAARIDAELAGEVARAEQQELGRAAARMPVGWRLRGAG